MTGTGAGRGQVRRDECQHGGASARLRPSPQASSTHSPLPHNRCTPACLPGDPCLTPLHACLDPLLHPSALQLPPKGFPSTLSSRLATLLRWRQRWTQSQAAPRRCGMSRQGRAAPSAVQRSTQCSAAQYPAWCSARERSLGVHAMGFAWRGSGQWTVGMLVGALGVSCLVRWCQPAGRQLPLPAQLPPLRSPLQLGALPQPGSAVRLVPLSNFVAPCQKEGSISICDSVEYWSLCLGEAPGLWGMCALALA